MKYFLPCLMLLFSGTIQAQVNDNCADAITLIPGTSCTLSEYSSAGASGEPTSVAPNPSCGFYQGGDVWFKAVMPASGAIRIETANVSGGINTQSAVYVGTCGAFTQVICNQLNHDRTIVRPDLAGQTLYFRIYNYNSAQGGAFRICVWEPQIPPNNDCADAIPLLVNAACSPDTFSNAYATGQATSVAPNPSCGFYSGGDVWFTTLMPQSGALRIETGGISGVNPQSALYTGTCGNFTQILCNQLNPEKTIHRPDLAGETIYVRIYNYNSEEGGVFRLCLWEPDIPANDNCENAILLEVKNACSPDTFTNAHATGEATSVAPNPSCGFYSGGDVWFTTVMPQSGALRIETGGISGVNPQSALYTGTCGNFTQILCNQLNPEKTIHRPDLAGETLYVRIYNYNSEEGGIFRLCLWEPDIPVNDNCENAITLEVKNACSPDTFTNAHATAQATTVAPNPSCGFYSGGDVWFSFQMPHTGILNIRRTNISGVNAQFALYKGTCGDFSQIACAQLTATMRVVDSTLAGDTLFLRVFNYNSEEGGRFSLCLFDTTCNSSNIQTADSATICPGNVLVLGKQHLYEPGEYTEVFTGSGGCDSTVTFTLSFFEIHTAVTQTDNTLTIDSPGISQQWLDCDSGEIIPGETGTSFTAPYDGSFAAIISTENCTDTSSCYMIETASFTPASAGKQLLIYPNPATEHIMIQLKQPCRQGTLEIYNGTGKIVLRQLLHNEQLIRTSLSDSVPGMYLVRLITENEEHSARFVRR